MPDSPMRQAASPERGVVEELIAKFDGATEGTLVHEWYGASHGREVYELTQADRELIVSALSRASQAQPREGETAWVIETGDHEYWNGKHANADGFTSDPNDAVRFARREDSERIIYWLMESYKVFLVSRQHRWLPALPSVAEKERTK